MTNKNYLPSSIFGRPMKVLVEHLNDMECIVKCLNCGKPTKYGLTRMVSGYVGCDNILKNEKSCYVDLVERVLYAKENQTDDYVKGNLYGIKVEDY
jgi:hypothetical protein